MNDYFFIPLFISLICIVIYAYYRLRESSSSRKYVFGIVGILSGMFSLYQLVTSTDVVERLENFLADLFI